MGLGRTPKIYYLGQLVGIYCAVCAKFKLPIYYSYQLLYDHFPVAIIMDLVKLNKFTLN